MADFLRHKAEGGPRAAVDAVITETGYLDALQAEGTIEAMGRAENLKELLTVAEEFEESAPGLLFDGPVWEELDGLERVERFLESVSLVSDIDSFDDHAGAVTLMTLHNAKGLEFPVVFIAGLEEGVFPHIRTLGDPDQLEEERRLAYVGITRAQQILYLTHAWSRSLWGGTSYNSPSRFLGEVPDELLRSVKRERRPEMEEARPRPTLDGSQLAVGDRVRHEHWGLGTVTEILGDGDRAEAVVGFDTEGDKRLLLAWAPLEKVT